MTFGATRDQLSDAQLALLSQMTLVDGSSTCAVDVMACAVSIGQGDGTVSAYASRQMDGACGTPGKVIAFESLDPFRRALPCLYAKGIPLGGGAIPALAPDARCLNGLFATDQVDADRVLSVSDPGVPHHLDLDGCDAPVRRGKLHLQLLAAGGTTPLAEGVEVTEPGVDHTCLRLDYTFTATGSYRMRVVADPGFGSGDLSFRFY